LAIGPPGNETEKEKARRRAEFILKIYEQIGYGAINIGGTDLVLGIEYLRTLQKDYKFPFLSANLKDKKTGKTTFTPYILKEIDGLRLGIIGLITTDVPPYIHKEMTDYVIEEPIKVATGIINGPMAHCDHIVALAHLNPPEIEELAKKVPQISIIIGGKNRSFFFPKQINRSIWVQTDAYGLHIGRMNLSLVKGSKEFIDILPRKLIEKNIEEVQKKMEDPQYAKEIGTLEEMQRMLTEQKKRILDTERKNTFENYLILLHPKMKSDQEIERMISSSRDQLKRPLP